VARIAIVAQESFEIGLFHQNLIVDGNRLAFRGLRACGFAKPGVIGLLAPDDGMNQRGRSRGENQRMPSVAAIGKFSGGLEIRAR